MKSYTKEFKLEAVKLALDGDSKVSQTAKNLGISYSALAKWVSAYNKNGTDSFPGKGKLMLNDDKVRKLEAEFKNEVQLLE